MMVPGLILAALSVVGGFIQTRALGIGPSQVSDFLASAVGPVRWEENAGAIVIGLATMVLAALLFLAAYRWYVARTWTPWSSRRSEEHTSELQSHLNLVCRLLLEKKKLSIETN